MRPFTFPVLVIGFAALVAPSEAFWRMSCPSRIVRERADPIVNPGAVAGHLHTISGGNGFGFTMDFDQARASQCSSCTIKQDFSNYWTPQLFYHAADGTFTPVPVVGDGNDEHGGMTVYYLQRGESGEQLKAFPKGFRMLAGDQAKRNFTGGLDAKAINFACLGANKDETNEIPNYNCPGGLRAQVFFPSCWDGKNLDSEDHISHMSYPAGVNFNNGGCPASHPVHLTSLFYEILYDTNSFADKWHGSTHPFVFSNGDTTGYGFHGDFVNGWDVDVLQAAVTECTNDSGRVEDCQHFTQYTGAECQACRIPASIDEQVDGTLSALPGCNPITSGPQPAAKVANCNAVSSIGQPQTFFTDLTVTKKWEYEGCGSDEYNSRTFTGKSTSSDTMTVETCVDFCSSNGFTYAGLEYARECYCGNTIAADRAPKDGVMGNCMTACAGDKGEYCGGTAALSIYRSCAEGTCQNAQYGVVGNGTVVDSGSSPSSAAAPATAPATADAAAASPSSTHSPASAAAPVATPTSNKPASYPSPTAGVETAANGAGNNPTSSPSSTPAKAATSPTPKPSQAHPHSHSHAHPSHHAVYNPKEWDCGDHKP